MMVAIPSQHWRSCRPLNAKQRADVFKERAPYVNLRRYPQHPRGLKKERTQRTAYKNGSHVSTAKILAKRI
jgi:hypothetical protein